MTVAKCSGSGSGDNGSGGDDPRRSNWPQLTSLRLIECQESSNLLVSDFWLAKILTSCPNPLERLTVPKAEVGTLTWQALQRHFQGTTLQVLHMTTPSWITKHILTSCPQLKEFRGTILHASDVAPEVKDDNNENHPWVCNGVRVLKMALKRDLGGGKEVDRQIFDRLCQLRLLQELYVCFPRRHDDNYGVNSVIPSTADSHLIEQDDLDSRIPLGTELSSTYGLDPRLGLRIDSVLMRSMAPFAGEFWSRLRIQRNPVGHLLLEIWPDLTSCMWHPEGFST